MQNSPELRITLRNVLIPTVANAFPKRIIFTLYGIKCYDFLCQLNAFNSIYTRLIRRNMYNYACGDGDFNIVRIGADR